MSYLFGLSQPFLLRNFLLTTKKEAELDQELKKMFGKEELSSTTTPNIYEDQR